MIRLRGIVAAPGRALGVVVVVPAGGRVAPPPARRRAQPGRSPLSDSLDVIIVARDFHAAGQVLVPWGRVAAIVTEAPEPDLSPPAVPTITGIGGLLQAASDGLVALVDAGRGIVMLDPSPDAVAAFQAETERIAPRRRIFLDYAHEVARTPDGREVRVYARAADLEEAESGVNAGADGLYLPLNRRVLGSRDPDDEQAGALLALAEIAGGKPIIVAGDESSLSTAALLHAAVRGEFTLAPAASRGAEAYAALRLHIREVGEELDAEGKDYASIELGGIVTAEESLDELGDLGLVRLVADPLPSGSAQCEPGWLENLVWMARPLLIPVLAVANRGELDPSMRAGAAGLIVGPDAVASAKEAIRGLDPMSELGQAPDDVSR